MFAKATHVGFAQQVVATLVACAILLWSIGAYATAQAANLTNISDTLSDSDLSVTSAHTIAFTIPTGSALGTGDTITITFPAAFTDVNTVVGGDITLTVNGGAATFSAFAAGANDISFTSDTAAAAGQEVVVAIADGVITNPGTAGSYEIVVDTGTGGDTGKTRVAIIDNVLVTAIVETTFDFTITGLATSTAINGTTTTGSTSPTEIPFGVLTAGETKTLAQQLNVSTNAINGFIVTVESDGALQSSTGADIDNFVDGSDTAVPTDWDTNLPSNALLNENTWGHWGVTTSDGDGTTGFSVADTYIAASTTPRTVFSHNGPSDGTTQGGTDATTDDVGQAYVGYQIHITPLQEAADDYNTTLTYIATPTF